MTRAGIRDRPLGAGLGDAPPDTTDRHEVERESE
jgi:hypothetical protein